MLLMPVEWNCTKVLAWNFPGVDKYLVRDCMGKYFKSAGINYFDSALKQSSRSEAKKKNQTNQQQNQTIWNTGAVSVWSY